MEHPRNEQFTTPHATSQKWQDQQPSSSPRSRQLTAVAESPQSAPESNLCSFSIATERARVLFGGYRKGDANEPDIYVSSAALVFTSYPESVVRRVSDPRIGIQKSIGWLPNIKEITEACEYEMRGEDREHRAADKRARETALFGEARAIPADEKARIVAGFMALLREPGLQPKDDGERKKPQTPEEARARVAGGFPEFRGPMTVSEALRASLGHFFAEEGQ